MNDESLEQLEQQIAGIQPQGVALELRASVLGDVQRELRAVRWDQRLARAAAVLLVIGVGINVSIGMSAVGSRADGRRPMGQVRTRQSLVETAVVVAEATDAATGKRFARQVAEIGGHTLSADDAAAIDAAIERPISRVLNGGKG